MKRWTLLILFVPIFALLGCSSSSSSGPSLYGNWIQANAGGTAGRALTLKSDGTYVASVIVETSATSGEAEIETGTFVVDGDEITATPQQWSCKGPDPISSVGYSFDGANLVIADPSGIVEYEPNTASGGDGFSVTIGCFDRKTGAFQPDPIASVSN